MAGVWSEVQTGRVPGRGLGGRLLPPAARLDPQTGRGAHAARLLVDHGQWTTHIVEIFEFFNFEIDVHVH